MRKFVLFAIAVVLLSVVVVSCDKSVDDDNTTIEEPVETPFESGALELTKAQEGYIAADNTFAVNLLAEMDSLYADKGYFFSPFSISTALSMLLNGTQGETAKEIIDAIGHGDDINAVNDYYNQILSKSVLWDSTVTLQTANAMISNKNRSIKQSYSNTLKSEYFADVSSFDFSNSGQVLDYINGWCNEKTHGMIPEILDEVSPDALLYILNAIYFKGGWSSKFEKELTDEGKFTKENGEIVDVRMMHKTEALYCSWRSGMSLLELPYGNGSFALQILLPESGASAQALASIRENSWNVLFSHMIPKEVSVDFPKFKVEQSSPYDMRPIVNALGMNKMFVSSSDFEPMTEESVFVSNILHKAALNLDEEGSEASAVTEIGMIGTATPGQEPQTFRLEFRADHPFYYAIVDKANGLILFMGKYNG
jgi:serpin B